MALPTFLVLASLLAACDSQAAPPDGEYMTLDFDGERWEADDAYASVTEGVGLVVYGDFGVPGSALWYRLSLHANAPSVGPHPPDSSRPSDRRPALFSEVNVDALIASYYLTDGDHAGLVITAYDEASGTVEGTFGGTFVVQEARRTFRLRTLPDTFRVSDVRFRATVGRRPE